MKAIIPAAGLGTRFLPSTKCTPKEMLPVLDKPVIQYVVEEALEPEGVDDVIIVTSPGKPELLSYFQPDRSLEGLLRERGKAAYADAVAATGSMPVDFRYQYEPRGLGHAIRSAADAVAGESFLVLLGDYVVPGRDICTKMLEVSRAHGGASVIAVAPCAPEEVSRYGVIAGERAGSLPGSEDAADCEPGAVWRVSGLVEKPAVEEAPSNLYIVGRYLLSRWSWIFLPTRSPVLAARCSSPMPWLARLTARTCTPSSSTRSAAMTPVPLPAGWPPTPSWPRRTRASATPSGTPSRSAAGSSARRGLLMMEGGMARAEGSRPQYTDSACTGRDGEVREAWRSAPLLALITPCFNEAEVLPIMIPRFVEELDRLAAAGSIAPASFPRACRRWLER